MWRLSAATLSKNSGFATTGVRRRSVLPMAPVEVLRRQKAPEREHIGDALKPSLEATLVGVLAAERWLPEFDLKNLAGHVACFTFCRGLGLPKAGSL